MIMLEVRSMGMKTLQKALGDRLLLDVPLARYTAARLGGPADALVTVQSLEDLVEVIELVWQYEFPYMILGGGSNVLISDAGVRALVIINRARKLRFEKYADTPAVWAESGVNIGVLARQAVQRGFGGLAWAAGIPGTVGAAVIGNAGAHGGDVAGNLFLAEILHRKGSGRDVKISREQWTVDQMRYSYRNSRLKGQVGSNAVLSATFRLEPSTTPLEQAKLDDFVAYRRRTQPPGASMGSMFKNPPNDYAGRLIEAAGLKGKQIGGAQISELHANFFINHGDGTAEDIRSLIEMARQEVAKQFGVELELEIELIGEWS